MNGKQVIRNSQLVDARSLPLRRDVPPGDAQPAITATAGDAAPDQPLRIEDLEILRERFAQELAQLFDSERLAAREAACDEARRGAEAAFREKSADLDKERERSRAETQRQQQQLQHSVQQLANAAEELREHRNSMLRDSEPLLIEIATAAVTKVIGQAAKDGSLIRKVISRQIAQATAVRPLRIRVSRQDMALLAKADAVRGEAWQDVVVADETLSAGDCFIETDHGTLEAGIDRQLGNLRRILLKAYRDAET